MPGFNSFDALLDGISVAGKGQGQYYQKASITTVANSFWSLWAAAGQPGPGTFGGTPLAARAVDGGTTGALRFTDPTAPDTLHLVAISAMSTVAAGTLVVVDRLLDYPGISCTSTSLQTMDNTVTIPRYTTGAGVELFAEVTTTLGATPQTLTITYVDQGGAAGVTTLAPTVSSAANRIPQLGFFIPRAAGDSGMRSITSVQFGGSMGAGVLNLTLCRPHYVELGIANPSQPVERNLVLHTPRIPQIVDDAALSFVLMSATTSSGALNGSMFAVAR